MAGEIELIERLYQRFNARDMEAVLLTMSEDVIWANGMEGGYVHGREGVRRYWTRQWTMIDPRVEPISSRREANGEIVVEVHQIVRDLNGEILSEKMVWHVFHMENGLVKRFDIGTA